MNRREPHTRPNTVTRTYPVYVVSVSDTSDDDNIIVRKPIKRNRHYRTQRSRKNLQQAIIVSANTDNHGHVLPLKRRQKSVPIQTDEIPSILSAPQQNEKSANNKSTLRHYRCLQIFALILAIFILIISMLLLAFSLNLLLNANMKKIRSVAIVYAQALPTSGFTGKGPTDTLLVTAIIGIILGSIIFVLSILSTICLICIKFRFYASFFFICPVLLTIFSLILVGLGLFIIITGDTELQRLASSTQTTVYYYYNSTSTSLVRDGWDFVQYYFSCCGVKDNNTDWYPAPSTGWQYNSQLPRSCCGYDSNDIGHPGRIFVGRDVPTLVGTCYYGDIGKPTCYNSIKTNLIITVLVFIFTFALLVLILAILFFIILRTYRKIHIHQENSTEQ